ncbi:NAD(P)/FAD-dependent oxidoreductase [Estrella lausannensis]|uniref:Uncharacterized protein n=1 Tax=Estrella lausannensis TaxID=483423 RepID=A0A0H5E3W3_9BACT|nr:NAD(P)/FAD-dependent oxidoreductase [Estrella lausannensis]CRX37905.1 hypothetical protein ELAC_0550 [Estrella lausannensis]
MKADCLIIGGGVAGLSALNRLIDRGVRAVLLEERSFPAHKMCGEFISPEALPLLKQWDIEPAAAISSVCLVSPRSDLYIPLKECAGGLSRYLLDDALARRAIERGAEVVCGVKVLGVEGPQGAEEPYRVQLDSGVVFEAKTLIVSTGRLPGSYTTSSQPAFCYVGAKAHFEGIDCGEQLTMYLMKGAYFGMASVAPGTVNVAGLISCLSQEALNPRETFHQFFESSRALPLQRALKSGKLLFKEWMVGPVPEFGIRPQSPWPSAYFVGDAKGVIPPAAGGGLSMALSSGVLAADCALEGDAKSYDQRWNERYRRRIFKGKLLHRLFLNPLLLPMAAPLVRMIPGAGERLYRMTRS